MAECDVSEPRVSNGIVNVETKSSWRFCPFFARVGGAGGGVGETEWGEGREGEDGEGGGCRKRED